MEHVISALHRRHRIIEFKYFLTKIDAELPAHLDAPGLRHDLEIRQVLCSTNAIESLNTRHRRAIKARGHFPSEQAALKHLYLATPSPDPTGKERAR
jgi:transposase-like protein